MARVKIERRTQGKNMPTKMKSSYCWRAAVKTPAIESKRRPSPYRGSPPDAGGLSTHNGVSFNTESGELSSSTAKLHPGVSIDSDLISAGKQPAVLLAAEHRRLPK